MPGGVAGAQLIMAAPYADCGSNCVSGCRFIEPLFVVAHHALAWCGGVNRQRLAAAHDRMA